MHLVPASYPLQHAAACVGRDYLSVAAAAPERMVVVEDGVVLFVALHDSPPHLHPPPYRYLPPHLQNTHLSLVDLDQIVERGQINLKKIINLDYTSKNENCIWRHLLPI